MIIKIGNFECTACPYRKGCETEYVCHTTSAENAVKIFQSGKLLSALKARNVPAEQLMKEARNAASDPADYFEYIMFAWGNCQAGDRLVMERLLGRFPNEDDLRNSVIYVKNDCNDIWDWSEKVYKIIERG